MTSRDRVGLAMNLDVPDRVPVFCQLAIGHYFLNARPSPFDVWFRSGAFANALVELQRRYRFDGILVNPPGRVGQLPNLLFIECPLSSSVSASRRLRSNTLTTSTGRPKNALNSSSSRITSNPHMAIQFPSGATVVVAVPVSIFHSRKN